MKYQFLVNGFEVTAQYDERAVTDVFRPMLERLTTMQRAHGDRLIVFLAAPPAVGKSTLAAFLEYLSAQNAALTPVQALGLDGFHYHQDYILTHTVMCDGKSVPMKSVKGAPESFDVSKLTETLARVKQENLKWPYYDRRLHDVVEEKIGVTGDILLIEGNWLLLNEPEWCDLQCDYGIFIGAEESMLRDRLVQRKMRGGLTLEAAEDFYESCDGPNIRRCMANSRPGELNLQMVADGGYHPIDEV